MKKTILFSLVLLFVLAGCNPSENTTPAELIGISINKTTITIDKDATYQLRVIYEPEDAADAAPAVVWESSKSRIVTVSDNGLVTGVRSGTAVITATCGKFYAECEVTVGSSTTTSGDYALTLSPDQLESVAAGGTFTIDITSNTEWSVEADNSWIHVSPESGMMDGTIIVKVDEATSYDETKGSITFYYGLSDTKTLDITRKGYQPITVEPESISVSIEGGSRTIKVNSERSFRVTDYDATHIEVYDNNTEATLRIKDNYIKELFQRGTTTTYKVRFTDGIGYKDVSVFQENPYCYAYRNGVPDTIPKAGGDYVVSIKSNIKWEITHLYGTLSEIDEYTYYTGDGRFTLSFKSNSNNLGYSGHWALTARLPDDTFVLEEVHSFYQKGKGDK